MISDACLNIGWDTRRKEIGVDVVEEVANRHDLELSVISDGKPGLSLTALNTCDSTGASTRGQL